jgi:hypothetical protein
MATVDVEKLLEAFLEDSRLGNIFFKDQDLQNISIQIKEILM